MILPEVQGGCLPMEQTHATEREAGGRWADEFLFLPPSDGLTANGFSAKPVRIGPLSSGHPAVSLSRLILSCGSRGNVLSGIASSDPCLTPLFITLPFLGRHLPNKASTFYLRLSFSKHRWRSSFCTLSIVFRISKLSIHCWSPLKGFIRNIEV